jgi:4-hydroxythreonine-4-phosphate dehydrogenase
MTSAPLSGQRIALTVGDPRGIGPELVAAAIEPARWEALVEGAPITPCVIGPTGTHAAVHEAIGAWVPSHDDSVASSALAGQLAGRAIERAVELAQRGMVQGIVTAPIHKRALADAGYPWPGHTEMLGALAGCETTMMLASDRLRVVLVTTHLPLRDVSDAITVDGIVATAQRTRDGLRAMFGVQEPRLALCALNPHAGDGGRFGDEDDRVLAPAARRAGLEGPFPADTVFVRAMRGEFDAVLTPVHDVGMTAIKVASFGHGVNITLGLPFVRTSPDHGTAFDIAGRGLADPSSFFEAVRLAARLVSRGAAPVLSGANT